MRSVLLAALLLTAGTAAAAPTPLQPLIDQAAAGSTLQLAPGTYAGPVVVNKPLTIDGGGQATIDSGGHGSVVVLRTDGAQLRGLHLTNSGDSHNDLDSGVQVRGNFNIIKDNVIDNCLFGIDLQQSSHNIIRRNHIRSKDMPLGIRGDAIRLWYSFGNKITDNVIRHVRDTVVWYSKDNLIARNDSADGRYSLHFMYSQQNVVEDNHYDHNSVGIFLMYSDDVVLRRNYIGHAAGTTGMGIGFKESSGVTIEDNRLVHCATGVYLDESPFQPDTHNTFTGNVVAYNGIGVQFNSDRPGNVFRNNAFQGNLTQVAVSGASSANRNTWDGNYWDDYEGFDRNRDKVGDTPYELYAYADRLWMDVPSTQFFKGAPMLEMLDFLERLAPFSSPRLMLRDKTPRMAAAN